MKVLKNFSIAYAFTVMILLVLLSFSNKTDSTKQNTFGKFTNHSLGSIHVDELAKKLAMASAIHQK